MEYESSNATLLFIRTSMRFHSALASCEPQSHVVVEQFVAKNISLFSLSNRKNPFQLKKKFE